MQVKFWYSENFVGTGIQTLLENISYCNFYNIDKDIPQKTDCNFYVFLWETDYDINPNLDRPTHSKGFLDFLKKLQSLDFYFIGDFTTEAHSVVDNLSHKFIETLISEGIDINRLILAKNDSYNFNLRKINYGNYKIYSCFFPHFFINTHLELKKYVNSNTAQIDKTKSFLCLNRRLHKHKFEILNELYKNNLLNDTFYTAVKPYCQIPNNCFLKEFPIQLEGDYIYGEQLSNADEFLYKVNPNWYYQSKVNIVTETIFYTNEIHITEKTWKPIYLGIPFVICGSKNHLHNLKLFGFKTFDSVIDESYDKLENEDRIPSVIQSAKDLVKLYNSNDVLAIIEFNQQLFKDIEHKRDIVKRYFIDKIVQIKSQSVLI